MIIQLAMYIHVYSSMFRNFLKVDQISLFLKFVFPQTEVDEHSSYEAESPSAENIKYF